MVLVFLYQEFAHIYSLNVLLMVCIGCFLGGPASLICAVISADLGRHSSISGNQKALATISGIIDGTGSLGAALGQILVGVISKYYGWQRVFHILFIILSASFLLLLPVLI